MNHNNLRHYRRLIVDTDLGLDDLVALAILRVQQSILNLQHSLPEGFLHNGPNFFSFDKKQIFTPFHLSGVTITAGVSDANLIKASLLKRLLPPGTPVYVGSNNPSESKQCGPSNQNEDNRPVWWTRTALRVEEFLSSLPLPREGPNDVHDRMTAHEFLAMNMHDSNVDILCMAPLSTCSEALDIFRSRQLSGTVVNCEGEALAPQTPQANFFVMGGIRYDSLRTKRGQSTAPFGYHDIVGEVESKKNREGQSRTDKSGATATKTNSEMQQNATIPVMDDLISISNVTTIEDEFNNFGEFNFALDMNAARNVFSSGASSFHLIPVEACTFVPECFRECNDGNTSKDAESLSRGSLASVLASLQVDEPVIQPSIDDGETPTENGTLPENLISEFHDARNLLVRLLKQFGTSETQWDSISAAIYCNVFDTFRIVIPGNEYANCADTNASLSRCCGVVIENDSSRSLESINSGNLTLSELGALIFPGCSSLQYSGKMKDANEVVEKCCDEIISRIIIHPAFSEEDEDVFFRYLSFLLHNSGLPQLPNS